MKNTKQRLFEMMSRVDKTFKPILNEEFEISDEYIDPISSARTKANRDHDWTKDAIEYVGGINKWNTLTHDEKENVINTVQLNENENNQSEEFFRIDIPFGSADSRLFAKVINVGIDSHLDGFTKSKFTKNRNKLILNFAKSEIPILLRRLEEIGTEEAFTWKSDIEDYDDELASLAQPNGTIHGENGKIHSDTGLKEENDENQINNDLLEFTIPSWAMSTLINGDSSGNSDEDDQKIDAFVNDTVAEYGNANFMLSDMEGKDDLGFCRSNDIDNLGSDCYRLYLRPSK
jgi:hypothetical protein